MVGAGQLLVIGYQQSPDFYLHILLLKLCFQKIVTSLQSDALITIDNRHGESHLEDESIFVNGVEPANPGPYAHARYSLAPGQIQRSPTL